MPLVLVRTTCESLVCPACVEALRTGVSTVGAALVLVPSFDVALRVQKAVAHEDGLGLGVDVSTPASWVEDMWELWGDGRRLVTADMRRLLVAQVLGQEKDAARGPSLTPGRVGLLCDLAARLPPLAGGGEGKLTQGEIAAIASLRSYYNVLDQRGLVEPAHVMCTMRDLLGKTAVSLPPVVLMGFTTLAHAERELVVGLAELTRVVVVQRLFSSVADEAGEALARELVSLAADAGVVVEEEWEEGPVRPRAPELTAIGHALFEPSRPRVVPTGAVCLLEPSGPLAEAELVTRELQRLTREGARTMVVCVPDPRMAWRTLAPKLVSRGLSVEADLAVRVLDCEAGRSFMGYARSVAHLARLDAVWPEPEQGAEGMLACLGDMSWWPPQELVDFLLCEVAHVDASRARALDVAWRSDRLLSPGGVLAQLTSAKATSVPVERATRELLKGRLGSAASKLLAPFAPGQGGTTTLFREESMAALAAVLDVAGTLKELGVTANPSVTQAVPLTTLVDLAELVLSKKRVIVRPRVSCGEGAPLVRMATRTQAASLEPASVDVLVACGLTSHDYAVPSADDVLNAILEALCVERTLDPLVNQRVEFARLCSVPASKLLAERPLFSADAKETYPAVMLTELEECYETGLPRIGRAENLACENVSDSGEALHPCAGEHVASSGSIDPALRRLVTVPQEGVAELEGWLPVLSASQLESYLECPLKWFSLRRLRLVDNDAGFGPLEMGTFAHRVLELARMQLLDEALTAQGIMPGEPFDLSRRLPGSRVEVGTPASLEHAREVLGHTFDVHAEHQRIRTGGHAAFQALVPHVVRELSQMDTLRRDLLSTLDFEAGRLQGFEPRLLEWKFGGRDNPMRYAGVCVTGTVDRVDVNAHGQALVIDYKHKGPSGFFAEYAAFPDGGRQPNEPLVLPRRIQSLLYAQVVRRAFPQLEVVGALYLGTRGAHELSGAVAEAQEDLVFGKTLSARRHQRVCVSRSDTFGLEEGAGMDALLDACEQAVAAAVERLSSGDIEARPIDASACAYCPVLSCERRMRA